MRPLAITAVLAALVVAGGLLYLATRPEPPKEAPPVAAAPPPVTAKPEPRAPESPPAPEPEAKKPAPRKAAPPPEPATPPPAAAPTTATLILDSDVPGASVFIDREYVGETPLKLARLAPGAKQVKLTADGFEGIERSVTLEPGDNTVRMRFKEVRLNTRIEVTHKHAMGSCEGALVATLDGLAYQTSNKNDAFTLKWDQVETLAVDYLDKNLKVKQKGGKTWNFTDKTADNADKLFVFQRDVEAARKKLAAGYAPVK